MALHCPFANGGNSFEYRHPARAQACRVQKWGRSLPCRGTKVCAANDYEGAWDHTGARIYVVARRARRLLDGVIVGRVP
jgi:hypothetical protein